MKLAMELHLRMGYKDCNKYGAAYTQNQNPEAKERLAVGMAVDYWSSKCTQSRVMHKN
jgi:hypothetical protein